MEQDFQQLKEQFKRRNIRVAYARTFAEARERVLSIIPVVDTVGIGNSQTIRGMGLTEALTDRGNVVYDKTLVTTPDEVKRLKRMSLLTDWYIASANAISAEGQLVNIDHSGNRVAAMAYGPDRVLVIVGKNKIEETLERAIRRAKDHAAPRNAHRAGYRPPCIAAGRCVDCDSEERVCFHLQITEGQSEPDRMILMIVGEEAGF